MPSRVGPQIDVIAASQSMMESKCLGHHDNGVGLESLPEITIIVHFPESKAPARFFVKAVSRKGDGALLRVDASTPHVADSGDAW